MFQSSQANEVSNWFPEKQHGMFTYFFLKGIQGNADFDKNGIITGTEIEKYVNDESEGLPYYSAREFQRPQKAVVLGKKEMAIR
jgi:hypothetical protein